MPVAYHCQWSESCQRRVETHEEFCRWHLRLEEFTG